MDPVTPEKVHLVLLFREVVLMFCKCFSVVDRHWMVKTFYFIYRLYLQLQFIIVFILYFILKGLCIFKLPYFEA